MPGELSDCLNAFLESHRHPATLLVGLCLNIYRAESFNVSFSTVCLRSFFVACGDTQQMTGNQFARDYRLAGYANIYVRRNNCPAQNDKNKLKIVLNVVHLGRVHFQTDLAYWSLSMRRRQFVFVMLWCCKTKSTYVNSNMICITLSMYSKVIFSVGIHKLVRTQLWDRKCVCKIANTPFGFLCASLSYLTIQLSDWALDV